MSHYTQLTREERYQTSALKTAGQSKTPLHQDVDKELRSSGYFAHLYHSWERGLNENTNGLIRQFFPKGKDLSEVTDEEVQEVMDKIINRHRKCLSFKRPIRYFLESIHLLHLRLEPACYTNRFFFKKRIGTCFANN
ncbi:MAG: hypothetical protein PHH28_14045 [Desulfuromonadaceae bacterium]|nr:hypothetical protein [Desulfuromonadaceae bacterium]